MGWIRISVAVAVYLVIALLTSALVSRRGSDITRMEGRTSSTVLVIGALANLVVLGVVLLLVAVADQRPLTALGPGLARRDALFAAVAVPLTIASAVAFLYRAGYAVLIGVVLVGVYGLHLAPRWVG